MKPILILLAGLFVAGESLADFTMVGVHGFSCSDNPCPSSGYWHNCVGTKTSANGDKYVGEYKDGKTWNGIVYSASGKVQGSYSNGKLIFK